MEGFKGQKKIIWDYPKNGNLSKQVDYTGNYIYENGKLSFILTDKGRIVPDSSGFAYEYFIKDHLGNTRLVVKDTAVISENHYYPFGLQISGLLSPPNTQMQNTT